MTDPDLEGQMLSLAFKERPGLSLPLKVYLENQEFPWLPPLLFLPDPSSCLLFLRTLVSEGDMQPELQPQSQGLLFDPQLRVALTVGSQKRPYSWPPRSELQAPLALP